MEKTLVLTFIAEDRPGLVGRLSDTVTREGGNWLESRMAHLAGKFAGIARIGIASDRISSLETALMALEAGGIRVTAEETETGAAPSGTVLGLDLVGPDQPGILRDISRCLAERGVSVEEMETDIREAPMGGGDLFYAEARVRIPEKLRVDDLRRALEALAGSLMVDVTLREEA